MPSSPRKRFVGISLKMYFSPDQTTRYIHLLAGLPVPPHIALFVIPDFLSLHTSSQILSSHLKSTLNEPSRTILGAQDCFWEDSGPYTGEISPLHLKELGCSIVELGHAERRKLVGETDEMVARKVGAVLRNGLIPLVCVGEKNRGTVVEAAEEIKPQVLSVLDVAADCLNDGVEIVFAYEPVWAIGQAEPASAEYVCEVVRELRDVCGGREGVRIIYGGSAGRGTWSKIGEDVDGLFLGRFAHDVRALKDIINEVAS